MMKEIYQGIFKQGNKLYTKNLSKGSVYGEEIVSFENNEYRFFDPFRSKFAAAILKGLKSPLKKESSMLYLGASSGTTISHISDILSQGFIYGVEFSKRVASQLYLVSKNRENLVLIIKDANAPEEYASFVPQVDFLYEDIAQRNQYEIFIKNSSLFLKNQGYGMLCIKARSIDVTKKPKEIFEEIIKKLKQDNFEIISNLILEPFQKDHCFILARKT
ncbi:MAG: fibrillarin-like rRNA/tRNA 2'-O-methyltransferase [Candidatus Woesearchaeota archaeon]